MDFFSLFIASYNRSVSRGEVFCTTPYNPLLVDIASLLFTRGYISSYNCKDGYLSLQIKYCDGKPTLTSMLALSKRSRRVYTRKTLFKEITVLTTSQGLVLLDVGQKGLVGGEPLLELKI